MDKVLDYLQRNRRRYLDAVRELAQIPAPSGSEERRARWCKDYLESHGVRGVTIDGALNVIFPFHADGGGLTVFAAHTDVVFPDTEPLPLREENGRLYAPGVGDDTANVAAVLEMAVMSVELGLTPKTGVLFVLDSGEEGLGNLRGTRALMESYRGRIARFYAIDGDLGEVVNRAVGSKRYRVTVETEGGHSYDCFGNRNAIHYMAKIIDTLYTLKPPAIGRTTYNVGAIEGGTSVNTIAQCCSMLFEYRSDHRDGLGYMDRLFGSVIETYRAMGVTVRVEPVGDRPCGGDVDVSEVTRVVLDASLRYGCPRTGQSGSTDCNIPLSMGIPAACFGVYHGEGAHTRGEWIDLASTETGMKILAEVVLSAMKSIRKDD